MLRPKVHMGAALLPLVTINGCYIVAVLLDHVPACLPYLTGCTSTSSAGRLAPESLMFRAGMIPAAVLIAIFWQRCGRFLEVSGAAASMGAAIRWLGALAGLSLILYSVTLGFEGNTYRSLRHLGIDGFFLGNFAAQVLYLLGCRRIVIAPARPAWRGLTAICLVVPVIAVAGELLKFAGWPRHPVNNVVEWNGIVFVCLYYAFVGRLWAIHGFELNFISSRSAGQAASPRE